jgi:tetratricopeptide (TPR) repeat protein
MEMKLNRIAAFAALSLFAAASAFAADDPQVLFDRAIKLKAAELAGESESSAAQANPAPATGQGNQAASNVAAPSASSPETSVALFTEAARLFEIAAASDWRHWYEAGNARWWSGDPARAIVDYRRYLSHDPFRGEVWENLAEARRAAKTVDPGHEGVLVWPWYLWFASTAAFVAGLSSLAFALFLFFRKKNWRNVSVALLAAAVCFGAVSAVTFAARPEIAVVIADVQGRKGDSSVYAPFPADPWKAGQEAVVTERRDTWARVLVGQAASWVPLDSLEVMKK